MASNQYKPATSFTELVDRAKEEIPPCPDMRLVIRQRIQALGPLRPPTWSELLVAWSLWANVRRGFGIAFTLLLLTSVWELSEPEPVQHHPMPAFILDRLIAE